LRRIRSASIATLGCKLNQSESDDIARQLAEAGVELVPFGEAADLCLVNSCTVTHIGDRKSRQTIRQAVRSSPGAFVVVVGCYAEMEPETVRGIEGVGAVLGNEDKANLPEALRRHSIDLGGPPAAACHAGSEELTSASAHLAEAARAAVPGKRTRALVKVQDGCDCSCSYCIVPKARGHQRSRPAGEVVAEIGRLASEGCQEVVLTGVNITAYGRDYQSRSAGESARGAGLQKLLTRILEETDIPRVRLSSLQPEDWTPAFYDLWPTGRMCRHLHLSLQSGSDSVLRRMRRRYNVGQYARIAAEAREALPGVALTTDVIVGFPGESGDEYLETERFLRSVGFAGLHVFKFSPRSGTAAADMPGQVAPEVKQERSDRLIDLARDMSRGFRSECLGAVLSVLWEDGVTAREARGLGLDGGDSLWTGVSDNYIRVYGISPAALSGSIGGARVTALSREGVLAVPLRQVSGGELRNE
jgi:threonylcarbamoyladenosine tRNA methylthiotransferase MtaB